MDDSNKTDDAKWVYIGDGMTQAEYEEAMSCINAQIGMLKQIQYNIYLRWSGQHEMYRKIMEENKNDSTQN